MAACPTGFAAKLPAFPLPSNPPTLTSALMTWAEGDELITLVLDFSEEMDTGQIITAGIGVYDEFGLRWNTWSATEWLTPSKLQVIKTNISTMDGAPRITYIQPEAGGILRSAKGIEMLNWEIAEVPYVPLP